MHLLQATPGTISDGSEAVDLGQDAGDIVFLSAADTELAALAAAQGAIEAELGDGAPSLRLANLMQLGHNLSVDLYVERVIAGARLVVVRLLGGESYWPYGVEQIHAACREKSIGLAMLPGDEQPDPGLSAYTTLEEEAAFRLWRYCVEGGPDNARSFLAYAASLIGRDTDWQEPRPLLRAGLYWPGAAQPALDDLRAAWQPSAPVAAVVFYRALLQAGNLAAVDALVAALAARGVNALPLYCNSLKDAQSAEVVRGLLAESGAGIVLNATGFALSAPGAARAETPFDVCGGRRHRRPFGARHRHERGAAGGRRPRADARRLLQGRGPLRSGDADLRGRL
jgi:cobaltochelatase CobN